MRILRFGYHLVRQFEDFHQSVHLRIFFIFDFSIIHHKSNSSEKITNFISIISIFSLVSEYIFFVIF